MNRTDRLHAVSEELRRAGPKGRTAAQLGAWLEVSTRTIKRDVAALQEAGLAVWAQAGPGGGYVMNPQVTLPPVNLTPTQAVAVAVALALAGRKEAPYATDGRAALEKVLDVMEPGARDRAERLAARVWVRDRPLGVTAFRGTVEEALATRRVLAIGYCGRDGQATRRRVEPHLLAFTEDRWYLVGWCKHRQAPRWFRWDRIESAHLTDEPVPERDPAIFGTPPADARPVRPPRATATDRR